MFYIFNFFLYLGGIEKYSDLEAEYRTRHLERIHEEREDSIQTHEIHMELMDLLKQINVYTGDIA